MSHRGTKAKREAERRARDRRESDRVRAVRIARANVTKAEAKLEETKAELDEEILKARSAGVVADRLLEPAGYKVRRSLYQAAERARRARQGIER